MKIEQYIEPLDDYTGALAQELEKLRMEAARGTLGPDEQVDLLLDVQAAVLQKKVMPWRARGLYALVGSVVCLAIPAILPPELSNRALVSLASRAMALILLCLAGYAVVVFAGRRKRALAWLQHAQGVVEKGGTVFDLD